MNDLLNYATDIAMTLGIIESAELGRGLVQARVGRYFPMLASCLVSSSNYRSREISRAVLTEDGSTTLTLIANNSTHGGSCGLDAIVRVLTEAVSELSSRRGVGGGIYLAPAAWCFNKEALPAHLVTIFCVRDHWTGGGALPRDVLWTGHKRIGRPIMS